jgi:hypothetical protein
MRRQEEERRAMGYGQQRSPSGLDAPFRSEAGVYIFE